MYRNYKSTQKTLHGSIKFTAACVVSVCALKLCPPHKRGFTEGTVLQKMKMIIASLDHTCVCLFLSKGNIFIF